MTDVIRVGFGDSLIEEQPSGADHEDVTTETLPIAPPPALEDDADGRLILVRALLLVQIGVIVTATIESFVVGIASPNLVGASILNGFFAVWTMFLMRGVGRRSRRSRSWIIRLQIGWILLAVIDLLLAVILADRGLEPVPVITRLLVPSLLIYLLRRPAVRALFEVAA